MRQFRMGMIMLLSTAWAFSPAMAQQRVGNSAVEPALAVPVADARGFFPTPASYAGLVQENKTVFGAPDCAQWLEQPTFSRKSWLMGFLSGYNIAWTVTAQSAGDPLDRLGDEVSAYMWMNSWCRANPGKNLGHGAQHLYIQLSESRTQTR